MKSTIFAIIAVTGAVFFICGMTILAYSFLFGMTFLVSNLLLGTELNFSYAIVCGIMAFILKLIFTDRISVGRKDNGIS